MRNVPRWRITSLPRGSTLWMRAHLQSAVVMVLGMMDEHVEQLGSPAGAQLPLGHGGGDPLPHPAWRGAAVLGDGLVPPFCWASEGCTPCLRESGDPWFAGSGGPVPLVCATAGTGGWYPPFAGFRRGVPLVCAKAGYPLFASGRRSGPPFCATDPPLRDFVFIYPWFPRLSRIILSNKSLFFFFLLIALGSPAGCGP